MIKIFVPLGTQKFPFERIILALNKLVEKGVYKKEEIFMQSTMIPIEPQFMYANLISQEEFNLYMKEADIIITHSGVNSIISAMNLNKPLIICPRLKEFGEHVDNHQDEIATLMQEKYGVLVCRDMEELENHIKISEHHSYKPWISKNDKLIEAIEQLII